MIRSADTLHPTPCSIGNKDILKSLFVNRLTFRLQFRKHMFNLRGDEVSTEWMDSCFKLTTYLSTLVNHGSLLKDLYWENKPINIKKAQGIHENLK